ncbi:MAG TPA: NHL repeat-containing protein, partial [bacterium]|nr:NHL repeat-containing protein [bacterium]
DSGTPTGTATDSPTATETSTPTSSPTATASATPTSTTTTIPTYTFSYATGSFGAATGEFNQPCGIAVTVSGGVTTIYVADTGNSRIQVYSSSTSTWSVFAGAGSGVGQFDEPQGVALDPSGNLYATNGGTTGEVQEWNGSSWSLISTGYGTTVGKFEGPLAVASDKNGNIFVTDETDLKNQEYVPGTGWSLLPTYSYSYPSAIGLLPSGTVLITDASKDYIYQSSSGAAFSIFAGTGSTSTMNGSFNFPYGLAVDSNGNVFVGDTGNSRIQILDPTGAYITQFGKTGTTGTGKLNGPQGVAVDNLGGVYVSDSANNRVVVYSLVP